MKKNIMFYCGIVIIILSLITPIYSPANFGRKIGQFIAGILITYMGYRKSKKQAKA